MWINGLMQFSVLCCVVLNHRWTKPITQSSCNCTALAMAYMHIHVFSMLGAGPEGQRVSAEGHQQGGVRAGVRRSDGWGGSSDAGSGTFSCRRKLSTAPPPTRLTSLSPLPHPLSHVAAAGGARLCSRQGALSFHYGHVLLDLWPLTRSRFVKALKWLTCFFRTGWSRFQGCISMEGDLLSSSHSLSILTMSVQSGVFWWIYCNDLTGPGNPRWPSQQLLHCSALAPVCRFKQGNLFWRLIVDFIPQRAN